MRIRPTSATTLTFLFLLTSLLNAAGHELLCRDEPTRIAIFAGPSLDLSLTAAGEPAVEHECPYCGLTGPRVSFGPSTAIHPDLVVAAAGAAEQSLALATPRSASHPARGPPTR